MIAETFLKQHRVRFDVHEHPDAYTAQELAKVEDVSGYKVAKPVIVKGKTDFAMCVLPAPRHLDQRKVAEALGEKKVRLASEQEMAKLFSGCEVGAEPPIGPIFHMKTIMDPELRKDEYLMMQAGTHRESICIRRDDWERVCNPIVASIALE